MDDAKLSHLDADGRASMVDIGDKAPARRQATASGLLRMSAPTVRAVRDGAVPKGNVIEVARIAGIQAAKRTAELVPLCHPLPLDHVDVDITPEDDGLRVTAQATTHGKTGVEMEALTAAAVALLTLYDMCKSVERGMTIDGLRLDAKSGGRSGEWRRTE